MENQTHDGYGLSSHALLAALRSDQEIIIEAEDYGEGFPVTLCEGDNGRLAIRARNEGGYNSTSVDLQQVVEWALKHAPDLFANKKVSDSPPLVSNNTKTANGEFAAPLG